MCIKYIDRFCNERLEESHAPEASPWLKLAPAKHRNASAHGRTPKPGDPQVAL